METPSVLLVCILVTCSVWTVHCGTLRVSIDDQEVAANVEVAAGKLPGVCWACKWALNHVKKSLGRNSTVEKVTSKLQSVCDQIGLLKNVCRKLVRSNFGVLIEELTTTDDVRTICVNIKACKPKEALELTSYPDDNQSEIEIKVYPQHRMQG